MTKRELFKHLNELCREMDNQYNINSGGCCYVAMIIAEQLERHNIPYTVYRYIFPCHFVIKVSDRYINRSDFNNSKCIIDNCTSDDLYEIYYNEEWNRTYDKQIYNHLVKLRIKALFRKYENNMKKITTQDFISRANKVHNFKYNYNKVNYINMNTKVCIICDKHGEFLQTPHNHLNEQGCPRCKYENQSKNPHHPTKTIDEFITSAQKIHNNKYDYSKFNYINSKTKGIIICPYHGEFMQDPHTHLKGSGCPECGKKIRNKKTTEQFINEAKLKHGDKYSYDKVIYTRKQDKVLIHCNTCNHDFWQEASSHLKGYGCPDVIKIIKFQKVKNLL